MSQNAFNVHSGDVGGTAINADQSRIDYSVPVKVQLTGNYATVRNPGDPSRPSFTGCAVANLDFPKTIPSGTTVTLLAHEAAALVAAGKASYV